PICPRFGLDPDPQVGVMDPNQIDPAVREAIAGSWGEVKTPGVMIFVVDNSAAMAGSNLEQTRRGVIRMLDGIDQRSLVGLVAFDDQVRVRIPPQPVADHRFEIREAVDRMEARGGSALYDAIGEGVRLADDAPA